MFNRGRAVHLAIGPASRLPAVLAIQARQGAGWFCWISVAMFSEFAAASPAALGTRSSGKLLSDDRFVRQTSLIEAEIGDELVALDVAEGRCFGFNGVATEVWRSLERPCSFTDLRDRLMVGYDVRAEECSVDLRQLIDQMLEMGLIRKENAIA